MATEEGIVSRVGSVSAWVKTTRSGACESCASRESCHVMDGGSKMEVEALNPVGAREGDLVKINFDSVSLLKISFLLYVFPVLCMIAGAVAGQMIAPGLSLNPTALSVVSAIVLFVFSFVCIRLLEKRLAGKDAYRPKIVRILKRP